MPPLFLLAALALVATTVGAQPAPLCALAALEPCAAEAAALAAVPGSSPDSQAATARCLLATVELAARGGSSTAVSPVYTCANASAVCHRQLWQTFAHCTTTASTNLLPTCAVFPSEDACLSGSYAVDACEGALAGMCGEYFAFPDRNCSDLPAKFAGKPCPVVSALYLCPTGCGTIFAARVIEASKASVQEANVHSSFAGFSTAAGLYPNPTVMLAAVQNFTRGLVNFKMFVTHSHAFHSHSNAFYIALRLAYPSNFYVLILDRPLTALQAKDQHILAIVGRTDLAATTAARTLLAQSPVSALLYAATSFSPLQLGFFMGAASAARKCGDGNRTVLFVEFPIESDVAVATLSPAPIVLATGGAQLFPYANVSYFFGIVSDLAADATALYGADATPTQRVLGSILIDIGGVTAASASGVAFGQFAPGAVTVDTMSFTHVPCSGPGCAAFRPEATRELTRALRDLRDPRTFLDINYLLFEREVVNLPRTQFDPVGLLTGADVLLLSPHILPLADGSGAFVANLLHRGGCCGYFSFAILHVQLQHAPCPAALVGRVHYAVAITPEDVVYVTGGLWSPSGAPGTFTAMRDVWRTHARLFRGAHVWERLDTTGAQPASRFGHASIVDNGVLYIFGGVINLDGVADVFLNPAQYFANRTATLDAHIHALNLSTLVWTTMRAAPFEGRAFHSAGRVPPELANTTSSANSLLFSGGFFSSSLATLNAVFFNPVTHEWTANYLLVEVPEVAEEFIQSGERSCVVVTRRQSAFIASSIGCWLVIYTDTTTLVEVLPGCRAPTGMSSCTEVYNAQTDGDGALAIAAVATGHVRGGAISIFIGQRSTACDAAGANTYGTPGTLLCHPCPANTVSNGGACLPCAGQSSAWCHGHAVNMTNLIIGLAMLALVIIVVATLVQMYVAKRKLRTLLGIESLAEQLAEAMENMDFSTLEQIRSVLLDPSRLQSALLDVSAVLNLQRTFMPQWVWDMDRQGDDASPRDDPDNDGDSPADGVSGHSEALSGQSVRERLQHLLARPRAPSQQPRQVANGALPADMLTTAGAQFSSTSSGSGTELFKAHVTLVALALHFDSDALPATLNRALELVYVLSRRSHGLFEAMAGYEIFVSFNALRQRINAYEAAVQFVCGLMHALADECPGVVIRSGIAAAPAHVGLVGRKYGRHAVVVGTNSTTRVMRLKAIAASLATPEASFCCVEADGVEFGPDSGFLLRIEGTAAITTGAPPVLVASVLGKRQSLSRGAIRSLDRRNHILTLLAAGRLQEAKLSAEAELGSMAVSDRLVVSTALDAASVVELSLAC